MLPAMSRRRRSQRIALVLIGTVALPACTPGGPRVVHDQYTSLEDCSADWGRPEVCDRQEQTGLVAGNFGGPRILFRGPDYVADDRMGAQYQAREQARALGSLDPSASGFGNRAIQAAVPSRGGFGASSRVFGSLG
jgi:uncharacterized protein YgiB involved in biofilm formation